MLVRRLCVQAYVIDPNDKLLEFFPVFAYAETVPFGKIASSSAACGNGIRFVVRQRKQTSQANQTYVLHICNVDLVNSNPRSMCDSSPFKSKRLTRISFAVVKKIDWGTSSAFIRICIEQLTEDNEFEWIRIICILYHSGFFLKKKLIFS